MSEDRIRKCLLRSFTNPHLTKYILITLAISLVTTFVTSVITYYCCRLIALDLLSLGYSIDFCLSLFQLVRPDFWLGWGNLTIGIIYLVILLHKCKKYALGFAVWKHGLLFAMGFPMASDLVAHIILEWYASYLPMYIIFTIIFMLLTFPVIQCRTFKSLILFTTPIAIFYFASIPIMVIKHPLHGMVFMAICVVIGFVVSGGVCWKTRNGGDN